ncbi:MAG: outer membrane protein assembly factor BamE [Rhodocyclaceae bacterium]
MHPIVLSALCVAASVAISGCSFNTITDRVNPYRIDVRQGNYVDQAMVAQLRQGMTRDQVRFVLGSPLIVDTFRPDRWDYVYVFRPGRGEPQQRTLSVFFENDVLARVEGDVVAADGEARDEAPPRSRVVEVPAAGKTK